MKAQELRKKATDALKKEAIELGQARFRARWMAATRESNKPHLQRQIRRDLARVLTILRERRG